MATKKNDDSEINDDSPRTQFIIKDTSAALKIKKQESLEARDRYKAIVAKSKTDAKLELARIKLEMSAREAASRHIAIFGPLYLLLLIAAFLGSVQYIPSEQISVVSALLTLLITMIGANLRSIVSETNGEDKKKKDDE
tara:strand:+ start:1027 stop:1443 length:417 start_codon:yes stop_codon:yes gene_type:complete